MLQVFKASALWADAFYTLKFPYACLCVCLCVCSLFRYRVNVFLPPTSRSQFPKYLEIRNPWGKVMERSGLRFEHLFGSGSKSPRKKKEGFFADFALQNMLETTLPDG